MRRGTFADVIDCLEVAKRIADAAAGCQSEPRAQAHAQGYADGLETALEVLRAARPRFGPFAESLRLLAGDFGLKVD